MASVWLLVETFILPIITYACETWNATKQERKRINQILDKIIRRILMTPESTPREALYIESGLLDIETISESKRLNMKARLNREKSRMMAEILRNPECQWENETKKIMEKHNLEPSKLIGSKYSTKANIQREVLKSFRNKINESSTDKSKMRYFRESKQEWKPGKRAQYMNELTRKQTSMIFKARTRMLRVKGNYKNGHSDQNCRLCGEEPETQDHILEKCPQIHSDSSKITNKAQIFDEDTGTLKETAKKIEMIMNHLK